MSSTVHYKGTLTKVDKLENEDLESQCKRLLGDAELEKWCDNYEEMFLDKFYNEYVIYDNNIYKVERKELGHDMDIFNIHEKNGKYEFEVMYYNGGYGFSDAIAKAFKNLKEAD